MDGERALRYLRMSINKGEAIVPLSDELDLTRTYLGIMQKRFSHQFEVEYDLDQAAMECLIPKLSLQPLVENALLHGILYCDKNGKASGHPRMAFLPRFRCRDRG